MSKFVTFIGRSKSFTATMEGVIICNSIFIIEDRPTLKFIPNLIS